MPMYRYACDNCGHETVVFHSMSESPEVRCEVCGSVMKKTVGRVGVIFKGSGFYITDSRKDGSSGKKEEKSKSEKKEEAKV